MLLKEYNMTKYTKGYKLLLMRIKEPTKYYYNILREHSKDVVSAVKQRGQILTAKELGVSQAKLSAMLKILEVEDKIHTPYLYFVHIDDYYKLGVSKVLPNRMNQLTVGMLEIHSIKTWQLPEEIAYQAEDFFKTKYIQKTLASLYDLNKVPLIAYGSHNEWFEEDILSEADIHYLNYLVQENEDEK